MFCAPIDQADGVPPQYPAEQYYQHVDQGKRNPPLSISYPIFRNYFLQYNIACGSKCLLWTSTSSLGFPGGSLGHPGAAGVVMLSVGLLGHMLDLVV